MNKLLPKELETTFNSFKEIFIDKRHFTNDQKIQIEKLGFKVYGFTHPKLRIGNTIITLYSSASDRNTYRQTLRRIRKVLIDEYEKGHIKGEI